MRLLFSHRLWFALARLPFRYAERPLPFTPPCPICGQASLVHISAGKRTMDYVGCEMIALHNALHFIHCPRPLGSIIETFERRRWLMLGGHWGADPYVIGRYLQEDGISFSEFAGKKQFSAFADAVNHPENRVFVLSYWLGDSVFSGAHAVTLVRREDRLWAYNLFNQQTAPVAVTALSDILAPEGFIVGYALGGVVHEA